MACAFNKGTWFLKEKHHKDKTIPEIKVCEQMQYTINGVKPHHFFTASHSVLKEGVHFSEIMCCLFCCFTHIEWHIAYMQSCLLQKFFIIHTLLFQKKYSCIVSPINWFIYVSRYISSFILYTCGFQQILEGKPCSFTIGIHKISS